MRDILIGALAATLSKRNAERRRTLF